MKYTHILSIVFIVIIALKVCAREAPLEGNISSCFCFSTIFNDDTPNFTLADQKFQDSSAEAIKENPVGRWEKLTAKLKLLGQFVYDNFLPRETNIATPPIFKDPQISTCEKKDIETPSSYSS